MIVTDFRSGHTMTTLPTLHRHAAPQEASEMIDVAERVDDYTVVKHVMLKI